MKYLVYGDIGGHYDRFVDSLHRDAGLDDFILPEDVTVIQLGDLVHKGPNSDDLVFLMNKLMRVNNNHPARGNVEQLVGNHESQYLFAHPESPFFDQKSPWFWNDVISNQSFNTLLRWWDTGAMKTHILIEGNDYDLPWLITHAGVGRFFMNRVVGHPVQSRVSLETLNAFDIRLEEMVADGRTDFMSRGMMIDGDINYLAGFVWAESGNEVYATWNDIAMPFNQVHGHTTPFDWESNKFYPSVPEIIKERIDLDSEQHRSVFSWRGGSFYGIDPGFSRSAKWDVDPLVIVR